MEARRAGVRPSCQPPGRGEPLIAALDGHAVGCNRASNTCRARHNNQRERQHRAVLIRTHATYQASLSSIDSGRVIGGDPATFEYLREKLGAARHPAFYLAIPPSMFPRVVASVGRCAS
jgi:glucose-6-phosphate 1-dehydrogenase